MNALENQAGEFGIMRVLPNSGKTAKASKGVAGQDCKTRFVVMPNWRAKVLISRDVGQAGGTASNPQYSASTGVGQRATACGKRPKTHAFQLCPQCHGFDDYCADVATCESCGGSGLAGVPGAPFSGAAMKSKTIRRSEERRV